MVTISIDDWKIEIGTGIAPTLSDEKLMELLMFLNNLQTAANMEKFDFIKRPDGKFDYSFKAFDGRTWNQIVDATNHADYSMTFSTDDEWKLSEFVPHRPLRDHVVKLVHDFQLEFIHVKFIA